MKCLLSVPKLQAWHIRGGRLQSPPCDFGAQQGLGTTDADGNFRHTGGTYKNARWRPRDVTGSGHRVSEDSSVPGSQPRALWATLPEAQPGICPCKGEGEGPHTSHVHLMIPQEVEALRLTNAAPERGGESPSGRGQQSQLTQSIVLSFLQQDARSPTEKGLICLHPQHNNLLLAFLLGLAQSNRIQSLPREKEGRRQGGRKMTGAQNL